MPLNSSSRLNTTSGFHSISAARSSVSESSTPRVCTSWPGRAQRRDHVVFGAPLVDLLLACSPRGCRAAPGWCAPRPACAAVFMRAGASRGCAGSGAPAAQHAARRAQRLALRAAHVQSAAARCDRWRCAGSGARRSDRTPVARIIQASSRVLCARSSAAAAARARRRLACVNTRCSSRSASSPRRAARARQLAAVVLRRACAD